MEPGTRLSLVNAWVAATPLVYFGTPGLFAGKSSGDSELATTGHINYLYYQDLVILSILKLDLGNIHEDQFLHTIDLVFPTMFAGITSGIGFDTT